MAIKGSELTEEQRKGIERVTEAVQRVANEHREGGGPVFPTAVCCGEASISEGGMSLEDYFAGQALVGLLARSTTPITPETVDRLSLDAYGIAFDMINRRNEHRERRAATKAAYAAPSSSPAGKQE